jgi:hypothetical protein
MYFSPSPMFWTAIVIFCFRFPMCTGQTAQDIGQLFGIDRIVPDLLPSFDPTALLQVTYNNTVVPGQILSQNGTDPDPNSQLTNFPSQKLHCGQNLQLADLFRIRMRRSSF